MIQLKGNCKELFEQWYFERYNCKPIQTFNTPNGTFSTNFYEDDLERQYGVYVLFFDSVGIIIDVMPVLEHSKDSYVAIAYFIIKIIELGKNPLDWDWDDDEFNSRQEAQIQAIKIAQSILNKQRYDG